MGIKKTIEYYQELINMMREDEKIFGLVREDIEKIYTWLKEIQKLKDESNNKL